MSTTMRRPPADFIFAAVILAMMVLAALIGWARSAHAEQCWKIEGYLLRTRIHEGIA